MKVLKNQEVIIVPNSILILYDVHKLNYSIFTADGRLCGKYMHNLNCHDVLNKVSELFEEIEPI